MDCLGLAAGWAFLGLAAGWQPVRPMVRPLRAGLLRAGDRLGLAAVRAGSRLCAMVRRGMGVAAGYHKRDTF